MIFQRKQEVNEHINISNIKAIVKLASILKEHEMKAFLYKIGELSKKQGKKDILVIEKTREERIEEIEREERKQQTIDEEREKIEMNTVKEAFRLIFRQKFFNQWRDILLIMKD